MNYVVSVYMFNTVDQLMKEHCAFVFRQAFVVYDVVEKFTEFAVLHYYVEVIVIFLDVMDFDYVDMGEVLYYIKFAVNKVHFVLGLDALFVEDFNCDFLIGRLVYGEGDLAEITSTNCVLEIVVAELRTA